MKKKAEILPLSLSKDKQFFIANDTQFGLVAKLMLELCNSSERTVYDEDVLAWLTTLAKSYNRGKESLLQ